MFNDKFGLGGLFSSLIIAILVGRFVYGRLQNRAESTISGRQEKNVKKTIHPSFTDASVSVTKESEFPGDWFTGKDVFSLERRAIFSKTWLFVTHRSRFSRPGDYHAFEYAQFPFFLILGKDNVVRAFHNVCRHRAYTITKKESGSSLVLGCRYHGWSYNTTGGLIKAPHFENVPGFDKSQNGLFEIHTRTSENGMIYLHLDASPTVPDVDCAVVDGLTRIIPSTCEWTAGLSLEGNFNWKLAASLPLIDNHSVEELLPRSFVSRLRQVLFRRSPRDTVSTHSVFPATSIAVSREYSLWFALTVMPLSASQSRVRCDVYSARESRALAGNFSTGLFDLITGRVSNVEKQYKIITQVDSSNSLPYICGDISTEDHHREILLHLKNHSRLEKTLGREAIPSQRPSKTSQKYFQADTLCKELDCLSKQSMSASNRGTSTSPLQVLAW